MNSTMLKGRAEGVLDERRAILAEPVSIVMPVYNEAAGIVDVVEEWHEEVIAFLPQGSECLFDDASDDGTTELLSSLQSRYPYIRIHHSDRDGFGEASKRLYSMARNPLVFFTDSDGQYAPRDFWEVAKVMNPEGRCGFDMLNGYKTRRKHPYYQIAASWLFNGLVRVLFASRGRDINSAFKLVRRDLLQDQVPKLRHVPAFINSELYIRAEVAGYRILDVPVAHRSRYAGVSKVSTPMNYIRHGVETVYGMLNLRKELLGFFR